MKTSAPKIFWNFFLLSKGDKQNQKDPTELHYFSLLQTNSQKQNLMVLLPV